MKSVRTPLVSQHQLPVFDDIRTIGAIEVDLNHSRATAKTQRRDIRLAFETKNFFAFPLVPQNCNVILCISTNDEIHNGC
jgi:hypothetical protein